jgi:RimJ/RimL family protein N-acetyltransferase
MLRGERVLLRAIEDDDLPRYIQWLNDPTVIEFFGQFQPMTLTQEQQWYEQMLQDDSVINFATEYNGQHIGGSGFCAIDRQNRNAEVGLFIGITDLWDKGLGREVLEALVKYGFDELNLNRIYLRVFAENKRAVHLYEKVGFQHEGRWRQAEFRHGRYHDMLWMSVLREEWQH